MKESEALQQNALPRVVAPNRRSIYDTVVFAFFFWFVMQDFILSLFYGVTGWKLATNLLFYSKDIFLIVFFLISLYRKPFPREWVLWIFLYFLLIFGGCAYAMMQGIRMMTIASAARGFLYLPCLVTIGYGVSRSANVERFVDLFMKFLVIVGIFGLFEVILDYLIGTKDFWRVHIHLTDFLTDIKMQSGGLLYEGLPGNFYGDYSGEFFSQKRLVSFFANPLTSGYVLVLPYLYYLLKCLKLTAKDGKRFFKYLAAACFLFLVIVLTFTRIIILQMAAITFVLLFLKKDRLRIPLMFVCAACGIVGLVMSDSIMYYLFGGSTGSHLDAIVGSINSISLFGHGIGTYGIYGDIGTESSYLTLIGQLGLVALILYLFGVFYVTRALIIRNKYEKGNCIVAMLLIATVIYYITGFISEQLFAYTTIAPFYLLCGMYMRKSTLQKENK